VDLLFEERMRQLIHVPHGSVAISISRSQFFRDPHSADMNVSDSVVICGPAGILVCVFAVQHVQLPGIMECRISALPPGVVQCNPDTNCVLNECMLNVRTSALNMTLLAAAARAPAAVEQYLLPAPRLRQVHVGRQDRPDERPPDCRIDPASMNNPTITPNTKLNSLGSNPNNNYH